MLSSQVFENQFSWITSFPALPQNKNIQHSSHPLSHQPSNPPKNKNKIFIITAASSSSPTSSSSNNNHHRQIHAHGLFFLIFFLRLLSHIFNFPPHNTSPTYLQVLVAVVVVNGRLPFTLPQPPAGKPIKQRNGIEARKKTVHRSLIHQTTHPPHWLRWWCEVLGGWWAVVPEWTYFFNYFFFWIFKEFYVWQIDLKFFKLFIKLRKVWNKLIKQNY